MIVIIDNEKSHPINCDRLEVVIHGVHFRIKVDYEKDRLIIQRQNVRAEKFGGDPKKKKFKL